MVQHIKLTKAKEALVSYVENNKKLIRKSFYPVKKAKELDPALNVDNWEKKESYINPYYIHERVHEFICVPFENKLMGYVYTDPEVTEIVNVIVQTE